MANYRPKSLSELNNVYDKAMRAEKAIKEGSGLLSATENETTPQNENIFLQLETKAAEADKSQVFDPDITNIANDFLKRYAQPEKPKVVPKEIKRPAPSIQSVYHTPVKSKEEKQDVSLNLGNNFASSVDAPSVPLHKPSPTMPVIEQREVQEPEVPDTQTETAPESDIQEPTPVHTETSGTPAVDRKPTVPPAVAKAEASSPASAGYTPPNNVPSRVRITSTERSELMEEYLRVMSDDYDDEPTYKKPKFSFFKKKRKYEEDYDEETSASLYEELPEEEDSAEDEVPVVPFDNSDVKYTDEYSNSAQETPEENMGIYDYIQADFDYDDDEDDTLDVSTSFPKSEVQVDLTEETAQEEDVPSEEAESFTEDSTPDSAEEETEEAIQEVSAEISEDVENVKVVEETQETAEDVVYPTEEADEETPCDAPPSDMVFEDIFSVSDESKRSHTGGNWEEVFGENFTPDSSEETEPEVIIPEEDDETVEALAEEYQQEASADYVAYEESSEDEDTAADYEYDEECEEKKSKGFLKFLMIFVSVLCFAGAATTILISSFIGVNSGKLIADKYRAFSVLGSIAEIGLTKGDLVITENVYAHTDDLYVYTDESSKNYNFGKVTAASLNLTGDYIYVTQTNNGTSLINRDRSMGVVIATYGSIGSVLSVICDYALFIAGALLIIAIAAIVCFILISKKNAAKDNTTVFVYEPHYNDSERDDDGNNPERNSEEYDDEYYDYDTDGIEQGLFSDI